jgi:hypothetical protein
MKTFKELMQEAVGDSKGLMDVAKSLHYKGQDKEDLAFAADLIKSNDIKGLKGFLKTIDTAIRDVILAHVKKSEWKKLGFNPIREGITDWEPGDGKPMTGSKISQPEYWELPNDELKKIVSDAKKSIKKKTNNDWKWKGNRKNKEVEQELNDIHDAGEVLFWRRRNGKIVIN